jgi:hypothetical protein
VYRKRRGNYISCDTDLQAVNWLNVIILPPLGGGGRGHSILTHVLPSVCPAVSFRSVISPVFKVNHLKFIHTVTNHKRRPIYFHFLSSLVQS